MPLANTPEVFGLNPNAEIGYYTTAAKEMWSHLIDLQPQTGNTYGSCSQIFLGKFLYVKKNLGNDAHFGNVSRMKSYRKTL